jgi:hypothetical protein
MRYEIPKEALEQTVQCKYEFACLETAHCGERPLCKIDHPISKMLALVNCNGRLDCGYCLLQFGSGRICSCPTRIALKDKYGI